MRFYAALILVWLSGLPICMAADTTAAVQRWVAHPDRSELGFTATQEGAQFSGLFQKFSVGLELVPSDDGIGLLQINAVIQLASVNTQYRDRDDYLVQPDWFYVDMWPEAVFASNTVRQLGNSRFIADGTLSLRGISQPVAVELQLVLEENGERGNLAGNASINRLDFGVGQGEWASTEWVGDEVNVNFDLHILRAFE